MSQHQITLLSPVAGSVLVTAGFDPQLNEAFVNYESDSISFMSPPGTTVREIAGIVQKELQVALPQQVIDGVCQDVADLRIGATNVGRRIYQYAENGTLVDQITWGAE